MKYVINEQFGGFGLSQEALEYLRDEKGWKIAPKERCENMYHSDALNLIEEGYKLYENTGDNIKWLGKLSVLGNDRDLSFRSDKDVVEAVEVLGDKANGKYADLAIKFAPNDISTLEIHDYDGNETLQTIPKRF